MICVKFVLPLLFLIFLQDEVTANMPGFPTTGSYVTTNITYELNYKCQPNSAVSEMHLKSSGPSIVTCDGSYIEVNSWKFNAVINGKKETLIVKTKDHFTFSGGNNIVPSVGHVEGGTCGGDEVLWVTMASADKQMACNTQSGLHSQTEVFATFTLTGKCASQCGGPGSTIKFNPPFNNWGLVEQKA